MTLIKTKKCKTNDMVRKQTTYRPHLMICQLYIHLVFFSVAPIVRQIPTPYKRVNI